MPAPAKIKAFCIDFNWGPGDPHFAAPGLWADADPAAHIQWYQDLGANVVQTFCVSCNGYAWYQNGVVPAQPGLKFDFLREQVRLGHAAGMLVMGYFCVGGNARWAEQRPDQCYGTPSQWNIPLTDDYLAYLSAAVAEGVGATGIDGFMVDWVWNPDRAGRGGRWLPAERELYAQLMGAPFPGEDALTAEQEVAYGRAAIDRCWGVLRAAAKGANPNCLIWLCCNDLDHPHVRHSRMFREVDWLMNEHPNPAALAQARAAAGPHTRLLQSCCGWAEENDAAAIVDDPQFASLGLYGFAKPDETTLPPLNPPPDAERHHLGNARNIATLRRAYHRD
jgi:hypothetical protein